MQSHWDFVEIIIIRLVELGGGKSTIDALKRENYSFTCINHQFEGKCEIQKASLATFKET